MVGARCKVVVRASCERVLEQSIREAATQFCLRPDESGR